MPVHPLASCPSGLRANLPLGNVHRQHRGLPRDRLPRCFSWRKDIRRPTSSTCPFCGLFRGVHHIFKLHAGCRETGGELSLLPCSFESAPSKRAGDIGSALRDVPWKARFKGLIALNGKGNPHAGIPLLSAGSPAGRPGAPPGKFIQRPRLRPLPCFDQGRARHHRKAYCGIFRSNKGLSGFSPRRYSHSRIRSGYPPSRKSGH